MKKPAGHWHARLAPSVSGVVEAPDSGMIVVAVQQKNPPAKGRSTGGPLMNTSSRDWLELWACDSTGSILNRTDRKIQKIARTRNGEETADQGVGQIDRRA
jgi:hypothetical protein